MKGNIEMFTLYINNELLLYANHWEELVEFVEKLKKLNKKFIDRRKFVIKGYNQVLYRWYRK